MRNLFLLTCVAALFAFSGCNSGEIKLLKEQVEELKNDKADLQKRLDEANVKLAKYEAMKEDLSQQMEMLKKLMPDVSGLGDLMETAKELGLPELKDFNKEDFLKKAQEGFEKAVEKK